MCFSLQSRLRQFLRRNLAEQTTIIGNTMSGQQGEKTGNTFILRYQRVGLNGRGKGAKKIHPELNINQVDCNTMRCKCKNA